MSVPALDPSFVSKVDKEEEKEGGSTPIFTFENAQWRKVEQIQREREGGGHTHTGSFVQPLA